MHPLLNDNLSDVTDALVRSVVAWPTIARLDHTSLPDRERVAGCVHLLLQVTFPGFFGQQGLTTSVLPFRTGSLVEALAETLFDPVRYCLRYRDECPDAGPGVDPLSPEDAAACDEEAAQTVLEFLRRLPAVRAVLATDVQAAFDSDPAATSTDETIFCYPGLLAIAVQRLAHEFYLLRVPLLPRVMTEHAHARTGIDIHPGATIGERFFIDHGTGVVIGETCRIGRNVKVYQGVTLGALAPAFGQRLRGIKRHPTIEDDVTIYAGSTILGGDTVIGRGTTIGGNVFITASVPEHNQVVAEPPTLRYRARRTRGDPTTRLHPNGQPGGDAPDTRSLPLDFQI